MLCLIIA